MAGPKESFHESVIIKRAKRRLIGAITILIILFTLSIFFIKNIERVNKIIRIVIAPISLLLALLIITLSWKDSFGPAIIFLLHP